MLNKGTHQGHIGSRDNYGLESTGQVLSGRSILTSLTRWEDMSAPSKGVQTGIGYNMVKRQCLVQ